MPDGYVCYDPPRNAPAVGPLPARKTVTFVSAASTILAKITPEVVEVWAKVLDRVPHSRLVLKYQGLGDRVSPPALPGSVHGVRRRPSRVELTPPSAYAEYLSAYGESGHRFGSVSIRWRHHDVRGTLDGRAGADLPGRDVCEPSYPEPSIECRAHGDDRQHVGRVRRAGGLFGRRLVTTGQPASRFARTDGRLTAVRWGAFCHEPDACRA